MEFDDAALEREMRAGLEERAGRVDVDVPVADRARRAARGRRTTRWAVVGVAAASVVAVAVVSAIVATDGSSPTDSSGPVAESPGGSGAEAPPTAWRTESWGDLEVEVPADWGYGGAPDAEGIACYPAATSDADGNPIAGADADGIGYVGRPIVSTDSCASIDAMQRADIAPTAPYVWLGAGLDPGVVELAGGYTQETVDAEGSTVTAATRDPALRERILSSATGGERCMSELSRSGAIVHDEAADPAAEPVTLRVCAYRLDDGVNADWQLTYAADLGRAPLAEYLAAVGAGSPPRDQCPSIDYQLGEGVLLELLDADGGVVRQDAVNTFGSCAGIAVDAARFWELKTTELTAAMVRPWAVGGIPAVVHGPFELMGAQG